MKKQKYKLRCRKNGIVVTSNPEKYDVVWKRKFNPKIFPMDKNIYEKNCECPESDAFINEDNDNIPYCRWCGTNFKRIQL